MPNAEQIKTIIQLLFGIGGPASALLINYGFPQDQINLWVNLALMVVPPTISLVWGLVERTHKNTIAAAAAILEKPDKDGNPSGTIIVSNAAGNGAAQAAKDDKVTNVNFGEVPK